MIGYIVDVINVTPALTTYDKAHLVVVYNSFNTLLNLICYYFTEDFHIYIHERYLFSWNIFGFDIR